MQTPTDSEHPEHTKAWELRMFLFVTVVLAPVVACAIVGIYGFSIWISQILMGPPTA
jgi:nitrate reductase NapE